jgi:hypothetical protein
MRIVLCEFQSLVSRVLVRMLTHGPALETARCHSTALAENGCHKEEVRSIQSWIRGSQYTDRTYCLLLLLVYSSPCLAVPLK